MATIDKIRHTKLEHIKATIRACPDFPKPGILFRDIFPLFQHPAVFKDLIAIMEDHIKANYPQVEVLVGLEARGFLFAPLLAYNLGISFVPIRKKGKLPGETIKVEFSLEYGKDTFEAQIDSIKPGQKVIIIDDLLATGGTMKAATDLVQSMQGEVMECVVVVELPELEGKKKLTTHCTSIVSF